MDAGGKVTANVPAEGESLALGLMGPELLTPAAAAAWLARDAVDSLPAGELDGTRRRLIERSPVPVLLVHGGLRPSGLAPDRTLTRFSWTAALDVGGSAIE